MLRVSFSILDPLSRGNIDEALLRFWRVVREPTQAMIEGKMLHEQFQSEVKETNCLPKVFGGAKLIKPETELKIKTVIDDWIEFVGVIDLLDQNTIYEYKTGKSGLNAYGKSWQIRCYQKLAEDNGFSIKDAYIFYFNQHKQIANKGKVYLSEKTKEDATEWIRTWASELKCALDISKQLDSEYTDHDPLKEQIEK